ncbi:hypothetical protein [Burkholderia ambifaria]|uniref:hypothetical protein n=1 Tax=Burkholderia ambifaria TaxID=152480 RepID=UPI00158C7B51|nr:hypothetical protein [Burkholderia ambifaria]
MKLEQGDVLRLSSARQAYVLGECEPVWLAEGTQMTVVRALGNQKAPSGYVLEAFVRERCRHALMTVCPDEVYK